MSLGKPAKPVKTLPKKPEPEKAPPATGVVPVEDLRTPDQYAGETVVIGVCAPEHVKTRFFASLLGVTQHEQYGVPGGRLTDIHLAQPGARIAWGRNLLVRDFLARTTADWLIQLDYDLVFPPEIIDLWLSAADPEKRPIAQMLYLGILGEDLVPFAFRTNPADPVSYAPFMPDEGTVVMVDAVAAGATITHRSVFERMVDRYAEEFAPYTWYGEFGTEDGREMTEDVVFSKRMNEMGVPMCVDTRCVMGHLKERVVGYERI